MTLLTGKRYIEVTITYPLELFHHFKAQGMDDEQAKTTAAFLYEQDPSATIEQHIANYND